MLESIKQFFKNIFKKDNKQYLEPAREIETSKLDLQMKATLDLSDQVVSNDENNERVFKLQNAFKSGSIEEEDLSEEEFDLLTNWYENEIAKTKESLERYKNKIIAIKTKLAQS